MERNTPSGQDRRREHRIPEKKIVRLQLGEESFTGLTADFSSSGFSMYSIHPFDDGVLVRAEVSDVSGQREARLIWSDKSKVLFKYGFLFQ
ncbi:MAG: PilZ domain-containing protein [Nitrospirota bacterium]|jgi:hypothetical protein